MLRAEHGAIIARQEGRSMPIAIDLSHSQTHYQSYLIRMWCSAPESLWRASAQHTQTGETVTFANLENLFRFLHNQSVEDQATD